MARPSDRILYGRREDRSVPYWRMATIWAAAAGKAATTVTLDGLDILDDVVWFDGPDDIKPTIRRVAERARDIFNADLNDPIVMTASGDVLDGAHRIARAYLQGEKEIAAVVNRRLA